jgi:hypothetical protein
MSKIVTVDSYVIPPEDIVQYPKGALSMREDAQLVADQADLVLNNVGGAYSDMNPVSIFYGADWHNRKVTVYDSESGVFTWTGYIFDLVQRDSDRTLIVRTANLIKNLLVPCVLSDTDVTVADAIYAILLYAGIETENINAASFALASAYHTAQSWIVDISYEAKDNITCKNVIGELRKYGQCDLYLHNNIFYLTQWEEYAGESGYSVTDRDMLAKSFETEYDSVVYDNVSIAYKSGASAAFVTQSGGGEKIFSLPDKDKGTTAADYRILLTTSTGAGNLRDVILSRYQYPRKKFKLVAPERLKYILLGDQIDLTYGDYSNEPLLVTDIEHDIRAHTIEFCGYFRNLPVNTVSRDTTPPETPLLIAALQTGARNVTLKWTQNFETDFLGNKLYFTGSFGQWFTEWCIQGKSPLNVINPSVTPDGYFYREIIGLTAGTTYYFKVKSYDTANNLSDDSNVLSCTLETTLGTEIQYMTDGNIASGIYLAIDNPHGGYLPTGFTHYDDLDYDEGTYELTAVYQSIIFHKAAGIASIQTYGQGDPGDIMVQWRSYSNGSYSAWSDEQEGVGAQVIDTGDNGYVQLRFLFYSPNWSDTDTIIVTAINEAA